MLPCSTAANHEVEGSCSVQVCPPTTVNLAHLFGSRGYIARPLVDVLTYIVQQYLLHYEGGHSLGQLAAHLHGPQAQRDDFCG